MELDRQRDQSFGAVCGLLALSAAGTLEMYVSDWFGLVHRLLTKLLLALVAAPFGAASSHLLAGSSQRFRR
ncbi:hypothetical protein [Tianweitania sediminis]|uniref:Uncharacterized protein n=1 Tax=Tianweitania sediminis TaxID=1502156 RepID=A0A8J7UNH5_9HYPH|nr:hypothetical protein [Tianweitania sediminis]MBP0441502.1 hypothetical protein [Tianweitania sediminis]